MKLAKIFFILLFNFAYETNANDLISHLNIFFKREYSFNINNFRIIMDNSFTRKQICKKSSFLLSHNFYHFGLFDILYICGKQHEHLKIKLEAIGKYVVANKKIIRGTKINKSDLIRITGRLDKLPNGTYLEKKDVINRINVRDILPFQPITSFITHKFWIIKINQKVTIKFKGVNFEIITIGRALENGSIKEKIRVQIENGKVVSGVINEIGEIVVIL